MNPATLKPEDFRRLYGEIPEAYSERVHRTLSRLPSQTQRARIAKRRIALLLAALLLLICGTVYAAARWGLVDFFDLYGGMPQSAVKIVSQVAAEYDAGEVVVVLRETVADSFSYHITAEVRPVPPEEIYLLPPMLDGSMEDELVKAGGRRLLAASLYVEGADPDGDQGIEWKTEDDGTLVYVLSGKLTTQADAVQLSLLLVLTDYGVTGNADETSKTRQSIPFTLPISQGAQTRRVEIGKGSRARAYGSNTPTLRRRPWRRIMPSPVRSRRTPWTGSAPTFRRAGSRFPLWMKMATGPMEVPRAAGGIPNNAMLHTRCTTVRSGPLNRCLKRCTSTAKASETCRSKTVYTALRPLR